MVGRIRSFRREGSKAAQMPFRVVPVLVGTNLLSIAYGPAKDRLPIPLILRKPYLCPLNCKYHLRNGVPAIRYRIFKESVWR